MDKPEASSITIFVGWSGKHSKDFATILCQWLPRFFVPGTVRALTSDSLSNKESWFDELTKYIASSSFSIFCLNRENFKQPWLYFEAGLAYGAAKRAYHVVCPLLIDLKKSDIQSPLDEFDLTEFEKEDFFRLIQTINQSLKTPEPEKKLRATFDELWPLFKKAGENAEPKSYEGQKLLSGLTPLTP